VTSDDSPTILIIDSAYSKFLRDARLDRPRRTGTSYQELLSEAMSHAFGVSDAMSSSLNQLGWQAKDIVSNARALQTQWALENGNRRVLPIGWRRGWRLITNRHIRRWSWRLPHIQGLIQAQVESQKPDVLYVHDLSLLGSSQLSHLKKYVRVLVGQSGVGLESLEVMKQYDLFVSSLPSSIEQANNYGLNTFFLPQAFDSRVLKLDHIRQRDIDISFVGSFSRRHKTTESLLHSVGEACPSLQIYGSVSERLLRESGLSKYYAGPAWGKDMYQVMFRSKIALNRHIALAGPYAANMRMFEATGCGALLLTEDKINLSDFFVNGSEVVSYQSIGDAALQASELLRDPSRCQAIARAGQLRTLHDHTYTKRMESLSEVLLKMI
jgi:spore maturation protein CgeB